MVKLVKRDGRLIKYLTDGRADGRTYAVKQRGISLQEFEDAADERGVVGLQQRQLVAPLVEGVGVVQR